MYLARTKSPRKTNRNRSARHRAKLRAKNRNRKNRMAGK